MLQLKKEKVIPLMTFDEELGVEGEGLFCLHGSYKEPLINLKVGPKEEITFLVDSGPARSSLSILPSGLSLS
jgi:hypothetical protein